MSDADYRALAERLESNAGGQWGRSAAAAILALLEERDAKDAYIAARAQDIITLTNLRHEDDSRLGRAMEALREIAGIYPNDGDADQCQRVARRVLSDLENSDA